MQIRILSGVYINQAGQVRGTVKIGFHPHRLISAPEYGHISDLRTIGPNQRFASPPAVSVAIREFSTVLTDKPLGNGLHRYWLKINDEVTTDELKIEWGYTAEQNAIAVAKEISYIVIGEVK